MNSSNESLGEFTHWKAAMAIILASELLLIFPASLFINVSVFITIAKATSLRIPLNLIHQSLLLLNCLIIVPDVIMTCIYLPPVIRFCECSQVTGSLYFVIELLYIVFQPLNYACLGIFQLLIIKGRRRMVSYKSVGFSVLVCIGVTAILVVEGITLVNLAGQVYICNGVCPQHISSEFSGLGITFYSYTAISWLPSSLVVIVCTSWSCKIFKNNYIGDDNDLNRRIISLPIVLPITLVVPSILSFSILSLFERVLRSFEDSDSTYWIIFSRFMAFQVHEIISGIAYPCILLYLNPRLRLHWNKLMLGRCGKSNQVEPDRSDTGKTIL